MISDDSAIRAGAPWDRVSRSGPGVCFARAVGPRRFLGRTCRRVTERAWPDIITSCPPFAISITADRPLIVAARTNIVVTLGRIVRARPRSTSFRAAHSPNRYNDGNSSDASTSCARSRVAARRVSIVVSRAEKKKK